MIFSEVEPLADAILFCYGDFVVYTDALLEVLNGDVEPDGNAYDFAFGMNWSGVIDDERVATYSVPALTEVESIDFHYADE